MSFRHCQAVRTLKGKSECWAKKCRFSVTNISAPTHSAYAAIKVSAGLNPLASYLKAISKGTTIFSSMLVRRFINFKNSLKASGVKFVRTSSTIKRGIRREATAEYGILFRSSWQEDSIRGPKVKIYWLESRTRSKPFLPEPFSNFAYFFNCLLFTQASIRRMGFRHKLLNFFQMLYRFLSFVFCHFSSPQFKVYYENNSLSIQMV